MRVLLRYFLREWKLLYEEWRALWERDPALAIIALLIFEAPFIVLLLIFAALER